MHDEELAAILPETTLEAAFYWSGLKEHRLLFQRCEKCQEPVFQPRAFCPYCLSDRLRVEASNGTGEIYSFSVIHHATVPWFRARVPYAVGIVELDEGYHMFTGFICDAVDELKIGKRVEVRFDRLADDVVLPRFALAGEHGQSL
jgi:uncharacterized protein